MAFLVLCLAYSFDWDGTLVVWVGVLGVLVGVFDVPCGKKYAGLKKVRQRR